MPTLHRHLAATAAALAIGLVAPSAAAAACADTDLLPTADTLPRVAASTLCLLNEERAAQGRAPVRENARLTQASVDFSRLMVAQRFFAHESPDGSDLVDRVSRAGYVRPSEGGWVVGENLAWAQGVLASPANVMKAWMQSPGHRRNVLSADYDEIGVGVVLGTPVPGPEGATFTTDFGSREGDEAEPAPQPAPASLAAAPSAGKAATSAATVQKAKAKKAKAKKAKAKKAKAKRSRASRLRAARARAAKARSARAASRGPR